MVGAWKARKGRSNKKEIDNELNYNIFYQSFMIYFLSKMKSWKELIESSVFELWQKAVFEIMDTFPKAKNGLPYLRMKNGRRVFFRLFLRKYGIDGTPTKRKYRKVDIIRRMKLINQFKEFFLTATIKEHDEKGDRRIMENVRLKAIIVRAKRKKKWKRKEKTKYELLSIFPIKK